MSFEFAQILSLLGLWMVALASVYATLPFAFQQQADALRLAHLDGLRGMAAIGVVSCHITQYVMSFAGFEGVPHISDHIGILSVQIFFALTAYLFTDRALTKGLVVKQFLLGRVRRILPLYCVATSAAIAIGLIYTSDAAAPAAQTLNEVLKIASFGFWHHEAITLNGLNMLSLIGIAWTLSYEWGFYLLLVPIYFLWRRFSAAGPLLISVAIAGAVWQMTAQTEQVIWPFFLPGVIGALIKRYGPRTPPFLVSILPWAAFVLLIPVVTLPGYWTLTKLTLMTGVFLSILFSRPAFLQWRPLVVLGTISYSIYLLQYLILYPTTRLIFEYPGIFNSTTHKIAALAAIMVVLIPVACLSYLLIERPFFAAGGKRKGVGWPLRIGN